METFKAAYKLLKQAEGGYVNHKNDRGGETYAGVARKFHPKWAGWTIIDQLKKQPGFPQNLNSHSQLQQLKEQFYIDVFWKPCGADKMKSATFASYLFDMAVLHGVASAISLCQDSCIFGGNLNPTKEQVNLAYSRLGIKRGVLCQKTIDLFNEKNPD